MNIQEIVNEECKKTDHRWRLKSCVVCRGEFDE